MTERRIVTTTPGFVIDSESVAVMFVSGHQKDFGSHNAEYVIGWKRVMQMILCTFTENKRMDHIMTTLHSLLTTWAHSDWMGRGKRHIEVEIKITEEEFLPSDLRQVIVIFHHEIPTKLRFYIKNKEKEIVKLKSSALKTLASLVDIEDVQSLGLPQQLRKELIDFKLNIWRKGVYMGPGKKIDERKKYFAALFDKM